MWMQGKPAAGPHQGRVLAVRRRRDLYHCRHRKGRNMAFNGRLTLEPKEREWEGEGSGERGMAERGVHSSSHMTLQSCSH